LNPSTRSRPDDTPSSLCSHPCRRGRVALDVGHGGHRRDRDREFADWEPSDLRRLNQELIMALNEASQVIARLTASQLLQTRTIQGFQVTGLQALSHTVTHLVGHTHQIVQLTRWHLGPGYRFGWSEDGPRDNVPL